MGSSPTRLVGKCAVVTGSASGIGRGIALRFASEGANVAIIDLKSKETQARAVVDEIKKLGVIRSLLIEMFPRQPRLMTWFQKRCGNWVS